MKMFIAFVGKEIRHILRDRRTMLILFGMPLIMMLLFGFAISTDVKDVRLVAVTTPADHLTQRMLARLDASEYFILTHTTHTTIEAEQLIRNGQADIAIVFSPRFADRLPKGQGQVQLILDGADPNQASMQGAYATQILQAGMAEAMSAAHVPQSTEIITRLLYNPQMKSAYNFVPGIMGLLLLLICAMMTSVSIVREKERGTMEVLLVSPIRPLLILIAKAVPYFLLSILILLFILGISNFVLKVPVAGNLLAILTLCLLYIFLALCLGLLISVVAKTQLQALLISGMLMLMPNLLLSGMIYPIESMPLPLQWFSAIIPARWFIAAIRKLMVMGVGLQMVGRELLILTAMSLLILGIALKKFKTRLE
ncbi:ABC transporter permease [Alloprevotella tannerae]|uniref:ABC transporter permease n=1 Tax=Alloprevotella tannerae TaxID=76122 RepID=UPI001EDB988D|nr:ABC transporter permease [Alloprevotella tannerae]MCG2646999.1 ABC transporter permease [Alloprevotella tannerae]